MSISTNILLYQFKILKALNNHVQIDSIYIDFQKAFDKVQHHLLIKNICNPWKFFKLVMVLFNKSYSSGKSVTLHIHLLLSYFWCTTGFSFRYSFIHNIYQWLPSIFDSSINLLLFVNDAKIFSTIYSPSDVIKLQNNLNKFVTWSRQNSLSINVIVCAKNMISIFYWARRAATRNVLSVCPLFPVFPTHYSILCVLIVKLLYLCIIYSLC